MRCKIPPGGFIRGIACMPLRWKKRLALAEAGHVSSKIGQGFEIRSFGNGESFEPSSQMRIQHMEKVEDPAKPMTSIQGYTPPIAFLYLSYDGSNHLVTPSAGSSPLPQSTLARLSAIGSDREKQLSPGLTRPKSPICHFSVNLEFQSPSGVSRILGAC